MTIAYRHGAIAANGVLKGFRAPKRAKDARSRMQIVRG
jgi:hypothetical protein